MKYMKLFVIAILFCLFACEQDGGNQTDAATDDPVPDGVGYGILSVTSMPEGATVFLNGEAKGVTQTMIEDLVPGDYNLLVRLEGYYDHEETVTVLADNVTDVEVALQPMIMCNLEGRWSRDGTPDICDVRQNGNEVRGFVPFTDTTLYINGDAIGTPDDGSGNFFEGQILNDCTRVELTLYYEGLDMSEGYSKL